jgi:hypothetical protein
MSQGAGLTPKILFTLWTALNAQVVCIHFCIEAINLFQDTGKPASPGIHAAPIGNDLSSVDLKGNVFEVPLPK